MCWSISKGRIVLDSMIVGWYKFNLYCAPFDLYKNKNVFQIKNPTILLLQISIYILMSFWALTIHMWLGLQMRSEFWVQTLNFSNEVCTICSWPKSALVREIDFARMTWSNESSPQFLIIRNDKWSGDAKVDIAKSYADLTSSPWIGQIIKWE